MHGSNTKDQAIAASQQINKIDAAHSQINLIEAAVIFSFKSCCLARIEARTKCFSIATFYMAIHLFIRKRTL